MAGRIFINYRRGDDPGFTHALYARLESEFTRQRIFMDVEGEIRPGDDFVEVLSNQVRKSDVVLVVIGPRWLETLAKRSADQDDFVQIEIKAALAQNKRVIPVLVGGASMPDGAALPEAIRTLGRRNAVELRPNRFTPDAEDLCRSLRSLLDEAPPAPAAERARVITKPAPVGDDYLHHFSIPREALRRILRKTLFAMSSDPQRLPLNGLYWAPARDAAGETRLDAVATDGHRMAIVETPGASGLADMPGFILPRMHAHELYTLLEDGPEQVDFAVSAEKIRIGFKSRAVTCAPGQGSFPPYARVIPPPDAHRAMARVADMKAGLNAINDATKEERSFVVCRLAPDGLMLSQSWQPTPSDVRIKLGSCNGAATIGFNSAYVADILNRAESPEIAIRFTHGQAAAAFEDSADTRWVLMPVKPSES